MAIRKANIDIFIVQVKAWVHIAEHCSVRPHDLLEFYLYKIIKGAYVLLYKTLDLQECWEQVPLVLGCVDGVCQGLPVVKGLEDGIKSIVPGRFLLLFGLLSLL